MTRLVGAGVVALVCLAAMVLFGWNPWSTVLVVSVANIAGHFEGYVVGVRKVRNERVLR